MKLSEKIKRSIIGKERAEDQKYELNQLPGGLMMHPSDSSLSKEETMALKDLLLDNESNSSNITEDFSVLVNLTSEIKSINHQSILLHGVRIEAAKELFKSYNELAFSKWLRQVYGNRQTPYNFLKYYLFYSSLTRELQEKMLIMPKQIIYTIASRNCSDEEKQRVIDSYDGESKGTYLKAIRKAFPLEKKDKRRRKKVITANQIIYLVEAAEKALKLGKKNFSLEELRSIDSLLKSFSKQIWED